MQVETMTREEIAKAVWVGGKVGMNKVINLKG